MDAKIIRTLEIAKAAPHGIVWSAGQVWTVSSKSNLISKQQEVEAGKLASVEEIRHGLRNPDGLAWTGSEFLIPEKVKKIIYKIDPTKKVPQIYMDLLKLKKNAATPILKARGSIIPAIAFNQGNIWIAVQAGYSSSILCFNGQTKELIKKFYTRGPKPSGIAFDPSGKLGWVLDGSNKELSQFDTAGNWTHTVLKVPLNRPSGLAIDDKGQFLTADLETKKFYWLSKGE